MFSKWIRMRKYYHSDWVELDVAKIIVPADPYTHSYTYSKGLYSYPYSLVWVRNRTRRKVAIRVRVLKVGTITRRFLYLLTCQLAIFICILSKIYFFIFCFNYICTLFHTLAIFPLEFH